VERTNRTYTPEQRIEAVSLALAVGPLEASKITGIPHRTISNWRSGTRHAPEIQAVILESRSQLAQRMTEIASVASATVLAKLRDPHARLGEAVKALEVSLTAARLLGAETPTGAEALSEDEAEQLSDWLRVHAPEIAAAEAEVQALGPGGTDDAD
jgi:transposase-like protein